MSNITILAIFGFLTVIFSVLAKVIGFPDQIRKNWKRQSTEGVSIIFYVIAFISYLLWVIYGILKYDWVVVIGQGLGVITTGVILWQMYVYSEKD